MLGGLRGEHRELYTENDYGKFEQDVNETLGDRLRASESDSEDFWGALSNVDWIHKELGYEVGYSFRAAGDLLAAIHGQGDYLNWYCSGHAGTVPEWVSEALTTRGWTYQILGPVVDYKNL